MAQLMKLFGAQFKTTFREKQVWFWSIFYPVILLFIFLTIFGGFGSGDSEGFKARVAVVNETEGLAPFTAILRSMDMIDIITEEGVSRERAEEWLEEKEIDAAIIMPAESSQNLELIVNVEEESSTTTTALQGILNEVIHQTNYAQAGIQPQLTLTKTSISSGVTGLKYTDFLLTGLIALAISQSGMFGLVELVEMRRSGLLKRLRMTPVNMKLYGLSGMLVRMLLSAIQLILLSVIGILVYNSQFNIGMLSFILIFAAGTMTFTAIGFLIASVSKSMESFMGIANLASFLMMFLSGIFFDYAMLPSFLKPVADVLPLTYFANGIRDSMVYGLGVNYTQFWINFGIMVGWGLVAFIAGSFLFNRRVDAR